MTGSVGLKVFLVDDHQLFRDGLKGLLELESSVTVVGESESAEEALKCLESLSVDVLLLDLNLPGKDGVWLVKQLSKRACRLPILVLSMHDGGPEVLAALAAGANGFVTKTVDRTELLCAMSTVANGGTHLSSSVATTVLKQLKMVQPADIPDLNGRELEIVRLVVEGKNNNEIADALCLSVSRIKFHLGEVFQKFGVSDRTSLAVEASSRGVLLEGSPESLD